MLGDCFWLFWLFDCAIIVAFKGVFWDSNAAFFGFDLR